MANKRVKAAYAKFQRIKGIREAMQKGEANKRDMARMLTPAEGKAARAPGTFYGAQYIDKAPGKVRCTRG